MGLAGYVELYVSIRSKSPTSRDRLCGLKCRKKFRTVSIRSNSPTSRDVDVTWIDTACNLTFPFDQSPRLAGTIVSRQSKLIRSVSIRSKSPTSRDDPRSGILSWSLLVSIRSKSPTSRDKFHSRRATDHRGCFHSIKVPD